MAVLRIREYGRVGCGTTFDPFGLLPRVTSIQRKKLETFSESYRKKYKSAVFKYGPDNTLVAQNFVGVINVGRDQIEVLPKIDGLEKDDSTTRLNLAKMIATAFNLSLNEGDASKMKSPNDSILEVLIRLFCKSLWTEVHKGLLSTYEERAESLGVLRGRLNIGRQIQENAIRPERLACEFDEFSVNNAINRTLKAALQTLQKVTRSSSNQQNIAELLLCFGEVEDVLFRDLLKGNLVANRGTQRYERLLNMARLFIQGQSPDVISGEGDGFALLFDMNELFEKYVGRIAQRIFTTETQKVRLQGPALHLARNVQGSGAFELRPDIVAMENNVVSWIVDTKWKRLDLAKRRDGVASADMYQMHAYAKRYKAPHVLLLYPHHVEMESEVGRRASYEIEQVGDNPLRHFISVGTVDLSDLGKVPGQLRTLIGSMLH